MYRFPQILIFIFYASFFFACKQHFDATTEALYVKPASTSFDSKEVISEKLVKELMEDISTSRLQVFSLKKGFISEEGWHDKSTLPREEELLEVGYGKSSFIARSPWVTVRYLGSFPAGAGLEGEEQNKAQREALGTLYDSIPVTTAAWAVDHIVEYYFKPLLQKVPHGEELLKNFHIHGAYYAPGAFSSQKRQYFDNAYLVGMQALIIGSNSCLVQKTQAHCSSLSFGPGHDPTVMGHEVGHAIFNHLRKGKSLDGFAWVAINEGYADYFSSAHFSDKRIGRIWRGSGKYPHPFLRNLEEEPSWENVQYQKDVHTLGLMWSTALWEIKDILVEKMKAKPKDIDAVFLYAISFLGNSLYSDLKDGSYALFQAADALQRELWKPLMSEVLQKRGLWEIKEVKVRGALESEAKEKLPSQESEKKGAGCAYLSGSQNVSFLFWILIFTLGKRRFWRWLGIGAGIGIFTGCVKTVPTEFLSSSPGEGLGYQCRYLEKDSWVGITFMKKESENSKYLLSNKNFLKDSSSIYAYFNKYNQVTQYRDLNHKPVEFELNQTYMSYERFLTDFYIKVGTLALEKFNLHQKEEVEYQSEKFRFEGVHQMTSFPEIPKNIYILENDSWNLFCKLISSYKGS